MQTNRRANVGRERHFATAVDGLTVTFECKAGHSYTVNYGKRPIPRRPSEWWLNRMLSYWSKENGGVSSWRSDCPKCRKEIR